MKPTWIIERGAYDDGNPQKMAAAIRKLGMQVIEANYIPIIGGMCDAAQRQLEAKLPFCNDCSLFYGSINAAKWLNRNNGSYPLTWANFDELRCQKYYTALGPYLLQKEYAFMPVGEIYRRKEWVLKTFGRDGHVFIRPDDNAKSFAGELACDEKWEEWWKFAQFYNSDPSILSIVSKPETISEEWRLVVANGKVITGSQYRKNRLTEIAEGYPPAGAIWVEKVLAETKYAPHPVFVVDIAITNDGFRIVEIGSLNTCGLYCCDIEKIVETVSPIAEAEWQSIQA